MGAAGRAPHERLQHAATVQRQAWHEVDDADEQVGPHQCLDGHPQEPVGSDEPQADRPDPDGDRGQRADHRDQGLVARRARLALDRGQATEEVQLDGAHGVAEPPCHQRVRHLVQQHRAVEDHREREAGDVLADPEPGLHLLDPRRHQERDQDGDQEPRRLHIDRRPRDAADAQRARRPGLRHRLRGVVGHTLRLSDLRVPPTQKRLSSAVSAGRSRGMSAGSPTVAACRPSRPTTGPPRPRSRRRSTASRCSARSRPAGPPTSWSAPCSTGSAPIDRLPEPPSPDAVRGTLVHKVLEDLFDLPAADRTPERARDLLVPSWDGLLEQEPEIATMLVGGGDRPAGLPDLVRQLRRGARPLLHPGGPTPPRARRARAVRRGAARLPAPAARLRRPSRRGTRRPAQSGGLQEREELPARGSRPRRCSR